MSTTNNRIWTRLTIFTTILLVFCECVDYLPSISQISPKSTSISNSGGSFKVITSLESTILEHLDLDSDENETREHIRIERSASPILNDISQQQLGPNNLDHDDLDAQKLEAGRYFQYNIKPTETLGDLPENAAITKSSREPKGLTVDGSFLLKGDLRSVTSGSPNAAIAPSSATPTLATAPVPNHGRQNPNPDIQDIITGIVKLLNGNVNVHANTQGSHRRPTASRINNRGPPRISDVQTLPLDYDIQKPLVGSSMRPPPYPFDRPERPFITGVPIPEQIVPYRPGFVSNRPPWHRTRPRPPITASTGGRRPIPQYKPPPHPNDHSGQQEPSEQPDQQEQPEQPDYPGRPDHPEYANHADTDLEPDDGVQLTTFESDSESNDTIDIIPTDTTYDNDLPTEDHSTADDQNASSELELELPSIMTEEIPVKKDDGSKKKQISKLKSTEKKVIPTVTDVHTTTIEATSVMTSLTTETVLPTSSDYEPIPNEDAINASSEDIIFMTTSIPKKTPSLDSTTTTPTSLPSITVKPPETTTSSEIQVEVITTSSTEEALSTSATTSSSVVPYHPRPGIVLDDPEFKPGHGRPPVARPHRPQQPHIQPTRQQLPPGYGEIFDVTLSAIQGPGSGTGSQQTINIKPFGYGGQQGVLGNGDIIVSPSGDDGFVSIDGKRTYINLFGDPTDPPAVAATTTAPTTPSSVTPQILNNSSQQQKPVSTAPGIASGTGYAVPETEVVEVSPSKANTKPIGQTNQTPAQRPHYRPRTTQPPVRIDTCIVGDDSTCDQAQHERCKTENGVSSCHCRPGYSRRKHREPCRKVVSFFLGLRVDRFYEHRIVWDNKLLDRSSEPYSQLSFESARAIDSAMSMTPYSDEFLEARVNNIYRGDPTHGMPGVFVNLTLKIEENAETLRPNLRTDVQKHLLGVLHRRNNNIGNSVLYVESPQGAISNIQDLDECRSNELNDCHAHAQCTNIWGSFRCACEPGYRDPWADQFQRAGRECQSCPDAYCNNHGTCSYNEDGSQVCSCDGSHYGGQCEIDGEVLGVAIGASVAAVIIIVLTLVCLIMWSRRWQREQKNAIGSPVFGYMNTAPLKSAGMMQPGYQVTLEDRMRWAQIADVMAQANHYGAEPIAQTRPSSAMFGYPNLHAMGLGGMSHMGSTLQMHQNGTLPPVPLPRLGLGSRSSGMRTLENSSSSEEEDRTDLLGRNFQVPRPKSRSNNSIANQSGIYYDVDYEPSGNGGDTGGGDMYGQQSQVHHSHIPGPQGIPMSTYTSGRAPSSYYMK